MIAKFFDMGFTFDGTQYIYVDNALISNSITVLYVLSVRFLSQSMSLKCL